jgi:glucokinase
LIGAVDIGGTKVAAGLIDDCGRVVCRLEAPTDAERGYAVGLQKISEMLRDVLSKTGARIRSAANGWTWISCRGGSGKIQLRIYLGHSG